MLEPLTGLDWLFEDLTPEQRLAVTFAAVGAVLLVLMSSKSLQRWLNERMRPLYADVVAATLLIGTCVGALAVILGAWDQTGALRSQWEERGLGGDALALAVVSLVVFVTTYIVSRFVRRVMRDVLSTASTVTDHQREITHRVSQVLLWSLAFVVVLGIWVDDIAGLLVGAGFIGIVLGMAARQTLGSMIAGFVLMFSRPFEIGDWIVVDEHEGVVTDVSIVDTRIRSFDGEYVIVPNDVVGTSAITNRSRRGRLRIEIDVGVDYEVAVDFAAELAEEAIADLDVALSAPAPKVVAKSFDDSAVLLGVRFWIDDPSARRYTRARTAAIGAIKTRFDAEGIKIPYPQRELSGRAEDGGFRVAGDRPEGRGEPVEPSQQPTTEDD